LATDDMSPTTQAAATPPGSVAAPGNPEEGAAEASGTHMASQWQLMRLKFAKHRLAVWSGRFIVVLYAAAFLCEFVAPYSLHQTDLNHMYAPPQRLHWVHDGRLQLRPFVYRLEGRRHPQTLRPLFQENRSRPYPVRLFVRSTEYRFLGLLRSDLHLFGVDEGCTVFLLGTDSLGRDLFTRIAYGARISLTVGLFGVTLSFVLGLLIGAISGYYGGWVDNLIQRLIEIIRSFPSIPLWMALSAALPASWSPLQVYFGITVVLSFLGWTGLARVVRGKILALREEDYASAAVLGGASRTRVMVRHLLPGFASHIIVSLTLTLPNMILGETSLSFLGLGLRPPITSWGVLLKEAQNIQAVSMHPWLLAPAGFVILAVLTFNFVGDGLRDAADPYTR
jgi:peptide/nickel transport system permease protein